MQRHHFKHSSPLLLLLVMLAVLTWASPAEAGGDGGWQKQDNKNNNNNNNDDNKGKASESPSATMCMTQQPESPSASPTMCPSATPTPTMMSPPRPSKSASPSASASPAPSESASPSPSASASGSPAASQSASPAPSQSASPSTSPSPSPAASQSPSPSSAASQSPSPSSAASQSPSPSPSQSAARSASPSPSSTMCPSASASPSSTMCPTQSPTPSRSPKKQKCDCECECVIHHHHHHHHHYPKPPSPSPEATCPNMSPSPSASFCPNMSPSPSASFCPNMSPTPQLSPSPSASFCPNMSPTPQLSPSPATPTPTGQPTSCPPNNTRLGQAASFSAFVVGNSSSSTVSLDMVNGDFESAGAVNGGLRLRNFGVDQAAQCTAEENQRFTLIVQGGTLDYANGQLFCGNLLASADVQVLSLPSFVSGSLKVGDVLGLSGIDFAEAQRELLDESETLCSAVQENNVPAAVVDSSGGITFTATGNSVETFSVLAADLSRATSVRFVGFNSSATEVIINVMRESGDSNTSLTFSNFGLDLGSSLSARSVLWNICGGTNLIVIQSFELPGALLAAGADVTLQNAKVRGQVAARTLRGSGGGQIVNPPC